MRSSALAASLALLATACMAAPESNANPRRRAVGGAATITAPQPIRLAAIPADAAIAFHQDGLIYVMNADGTNRTQITFDDPRVWEHVAVSPDRRYIAANEQMPNPGDEPGGRSRIWIFDLQAQTAARLLPGFRMTGNGGVDWDPGGFLYFAARERDVFANPTKVEEFRANAGANDIYRIRPDGTGLQRLLNTPAAGEADVSVSEDGTMIAYVHQPVGSEPPHTEIWVANSDGTNPRAVYAGGQVAVASVHDPELSPDNTHVVFSKVNSSVPPNFPDNPAANTAHDIWQTRIDGTNAIRLTRPGPISITPDWKGDAILYLDISERERWAGVSIVRPDVPEQRQQRIREGANIAKWIPERPSN